MKITWRPPTLSELTPNLISLGLTQLRLGGPYINVIFLCDFFIFISIYLLLESHIQIYTGNFKEFSFLLELLFDWHWIYISLKCFSYVDVRILLQKNKRDVFHKFIFLVQQEIFLFVLSPVKIKNLDFVNVWEVLVRKSLDTFNPQLSVFFI